VSEEKIGGSRIKSETIEENQVWMRNSGNHFIVKWIGYGLVPIQVKTFTIETRKTQDMTMSTLLSRKRTYRIVEHLPQCKVCSLHAQIRYGKVNDQLTYHVSCDCLEFDGSSTDIEVAIRSWKSNMKYIGSTTARYRPGNEGVIRKARAGA